MLGEQRIHEICQQVLQRCGSDQAELLINCEESALTRFANNTIHQNVAQSDTNLTVRIVLGQRSGAASTNRLEPGALDEVVAQARQNAAASPEDPDYPELPEPQPLTRVDSFDPQAAACTPEQRARSVGVVCRLASEKGLNASGAFTAGGEEFGVANSRGVFAYHKVTEVDFQTTVMSADSSGRAQSSGWRLSDIDAEGTGRQAIEKAERGRGPRKVEPGEYTVVFDPYVTQDITDLLSFYGMGGQAVLEGRSWMNERMGQQVMSPQVSIWDDGCDPAGKPLPFDFEGMPRQRVDIVRQGVVGSPVYDRYTARKAGVPSTGHAMPPSFRMLGPVPIHLFMAPGQSSVEEMIRSTERGLYITRFWYTRVVHPRDCIITGMTRDGVFMIENGELAYPVKNLRFTQSYVQALADVQAVGRESCLLSAEWGSIASRVPALKIARFNFTGSTV